MKPSFVNLTRHSDDSISTIKPTSEAVNCSRLLTPHLRCLHRSVPQTSLQRVSSFNISDTPAIKMKTYLTAYLPLKPSSYLQHVPCQTAMLLTCSSSVLTSCHALTYVSVSLILHVLPSRIRRRQFLLPIKFAGHTRRTGPSFTFSAGYCLR